MMDEVWKDIDGFDGLYQISNHGRVKSLSKEFLVSNQYCKTNNYRKTKERILKPQLDKHGYHRITLCKDGKKYLKQIHRLVALAFVSNPCDLPLVNHKNEIKTDNRSCNLEFCTSSYNQNYGTIKERISAAQSFDITQHTLGGLFIKKWHGINKASRELKINHANIISCCQGKRKSAGGYIWRYCDE